jgi:hypothetical protein
VCDACGKKRDEIVVDILNYFLRNPAAVDSFDGIARWRVMEEIARRSLGDTEDALRWLITGGYLQEEQVLGGKAVYRLDHDHREEASRLVSEALRSNRESA